ncbi:MAG: sugar ABC transporter substrate-binding protein [Arcanobacterium sp.]|nr:sugar ABC transporter substrate-binding protein [Arcanobacterium sp.]
MKRKYVLGAIATATALALGACSPAANTESKNTSSEKTTVTFRLWDDTAAPSYIRSFEAFEAKNTDIDVKVEVVPWDAYWNQLPLDISAKQMADVYWVNSSNFALYADAGNLLDISETLGTDHDEWQQSVVDLYTYKGKLWGVPQIWDSIALFYNKDQVSAAGVDPTNLTWAANGGDGDTFIEAAKKLTLDANGKNATEADFDAANIKTYAFNAQADLQAIYLDFMAQNGTPLQTEDGALNLDTPEAVESFQYLVDLINTHKVSPSAAETNVNGELAQEMFMRGEMALFQSGPYSLKTIAEKSNINWGIAPMVAGPEGRVSVVHGVAAVGNADTAHPEETARVLEWLGSAEGQMALAEDGVAFPGAVEAQEAFVNYWAKKSVDVSVFIEAASGETTAAPYGPDINAGLNAAVPVLKDIFLGAKDVAEGLAEANKLGNEAMKQ